MSAATVARVLVLGLSTGALAGQQPLLSASGTLADCGTLSALQLPDVTITGAVPVPAAATGAVRAAHCRVDGASLTGLTETQTRTLRAIYAETRNRDGVIYPGQPVGGEGAGAGWAPWIVGPSPMTMKAQNAPSLRFAFGTELFKYFIFNDPEWDYRRYAFDDFARQSAQAARILNATNPDLSAFKAKGRKLILWHGWSDAALTALGTIKYYDQVQARDAQVRDYARLFMMPGVLHCAGGPGPDQVDWTSAIDTWVEHGRSPDRLVARKLASDGTASLTRPLCVYPQRAVYSGTGNPSDEASFACR